MTTDRDLVVLVDAEDAAVGTAEKIEAHRHGLKHRAISALIRNAAGEFLLQRRAAGKYHSGGLWTNACCSHPRPGESAAEAAQRRLRDEMGFACRLEPLFVVHYQAPVSDGLIENELVHVFAGQHDGPIDPHPAEVSAWKWLRLDALEAHMRTHPEAYTVWFRQYMAQYRTPIAAWLAR